MAKYQCTVCGTIVNSTSGHGSCPKNGGKPHIWNRLDRFIKQLFNW